MNVIAVLDDNNGMMFNHRRQSQDIALREHIIGLIAGHKLYMNMYSAKQFSDIDSANIIVSEDYLSAAGDEDYCFVEDKPLSSYIDKINRIYLYKWNRSYPADLKFDVDLISLGWKKTILTEFQGKSHERITLEEWTHA